MEQANLLDYIQNLTTGDESELNYLIQSGDISRAVQLTTAAILAIHFIANEKSTESQAHTLAERRIKVDIC